MHDLYELRDKLCNELKEYGKKEKLDVQTLQIVDTLAHSLKNVCKIIEYYDVDNNEYSYAPMDYSYMTMPRVSYSRGRGANARRDSMGRYSSRDGGYSNGVDFRTDMQNLMQNAPNDYVRQKIAEAMNGM